ncbi:MAG: type II toxin-antitoxin system PemK/MazF family toxin [Propionivibrio sp.]
MKRGDLVTIAMQGDFGKPRPALVIQADQFDEHASVTILPVTSSLVDAPLVRVTIEPSSGNSLQKTSQVMIDKAMTVKRDRIGQSFGRIDAEAMVEVERFLLVFLGIAG